VTLYQNVHSGKYHYHKRCIKGKFKIQIQNSKFKIQNSKVKIALSLNTMIPVVFGTKVRWDIETTKDEFL